jgi:YD repeat-containing protein
MSAAVVSVPQRSDQALDRLVAWAAQTAAQRAAVVPSRLDFDAQGDLTLIVEPDGSRRAFGYDDKRRLVQVQDNSGCTRYEYDTDDRLIRVAGPQGESRHVFDAAGRLAEVQRSAGEGVRYRYDSAGRVLEYRTAQVSCTQAFDAAGRVCAVAQAVDGVVIDAQLVFDAAGRLSQMRLPGGRVVGYAWGRQGQLAQVRLDGAPLTDWALQGPEERIGFAGGVSQVSRFDAVDARLLERRIEQPGTSERRVLEVRRYRYDDAGRVIDDGQAQYRYDAAGRLVHAGRAEPVEAPADERLFDARGELIEVRRAGHTIARLGYDAKGRLAWMRLATHTERYLYGPADELLAVCDATGTFLRAYVHTPAGCLAEIEGGDIRFLHLDRRGATSLITDIHGEPVAHHCLDPWGAPLQDDLAAPPPWFGSRRWVRELGLYRFGARWYDPRARRFLNADTYTAAPDDERLVHPLLGGAAQVALRDQMLANWLRHPSARERFGFCHGDPVNRVDPNGHWSFGGVLLSILGALWTLPNTLFGLLIEITCLIGEVVRWLAWLFSGGNLTWATPGFDAAASGHLNAFALVFRGGWLGSFSSPPPAAPSSRRPTTARSRSRPKTRCTNTSCGT